MVPVQTLDRQTLDSTNPRQYKPQTGTNPRQVQTLDSTNPRQDKPQTGTNPRQNPRQSPRQSPRQNDIQNAKQTLNNLSLHEFKLIMKLKKCILSKKIIYRLIFNNILNNHLKTEFDINDFEFKSFKD